MDELNGRKLMPFASQAEFEAWLEQNQDHNPGIWLMIAKKKSGLPTVTYDEAVDTALCFGWIDGQKRAHDETYFLQGFTPRRKRSIWSKVNTEKVERLIAAGRMREAGLREVAAAKADGRWDAAYHPASTAEVPKDLQAAIDAQPAARANFAALSKANRYSFIYRVNDAKRPETRQRRIEQFVQLLAEGKKLN